MAFSRRFALGVCALIFGGSWNLATAAPPPAPEIMSTTLCDSQGMHRAQRHLRDGARDKDVRDNESRGYGEVLRPVDRGIRTHTE